MSLDRQHLGDIIYGEVYQAPEGEHRNVTVPAALLALFPEIRLSPWSQSDMRIRLLRGNSRNERKRNELHVGSIRVFILPLLFTLENDEIDPFVPHLCDRRHVRCGRGGVAQSRHPDIKGWVPYARHDPEPNILMFRRTHQERQHEAERRRARSRARVA